MRHVDENGIVTTIARVGWSDRRGEKVAIVPEDDNAAAAEREWGLMGDGLAILHVGQPILVRFNLHDQYVHHVTMKEAATAIQAQRIRQY